MEPVKPRRKKKDKRSKKHNKRSRVRTKFLIESLRQDYYNLRDENDRLRGIVKDNLPKVTAESILAECFDLDAPVAKVSSIDDLAEKVPGIHISGDEEEYDSE